MPKTPALWRAVLTLVLSLSVPARAQIGVRVLLGVMDEVGTTWDGSVSAEGASITRLDPWRFGKGDETNNDGSWKIATRPVLSFFHLVTRLTPPVGDNGVVVWLSEDNPNAELRVKTAQVLVGQQIGFTACIPSLQLAELTIQKSWTMPSNWSTNGQPAAAAGWSVTNPAADCTPSPPAQYCNYVATLTPVATAASGCGGVQSCDFYTYYFVVPGTYTFTFSYTVPGGTASSSVTYVASGPTNVNVALDYGAST